MTGNYAGSDCNGNGFFLEQGASPYSEVCPDTDYTLTSQGEVNAFPQDCSEIAGNLTIGPSSDIVDLSPLKWITTVGGTVTIDGNTMLSGVDGLAFRAASDGQRVASKTSEASLTEIGGSLIVTQNPLLASLASFSSIANIGGDLVVTGNGSLADCSEGLYAVVSGGGVSGSVSMSGNSSSGDCNNDGADLTDTITAVDGTELPDGIVLQAAYPNPFNPTTTLAYELPRAAHVRLAVYDGLGRLVRRVIDGPSAAGRFEAILDAGGLPSGVYLVRLQADGQVANRRIVLLR